MTINILIIRFDIPKRIYAFNINNNRNTIVTLKTQHNNLKSMQKQYKPFAYVVFAVNH